MNLRRLDLNLLLVLDAVIAERSVTRAATRLGMSQPAVSNALARLRKQFDDELLVRGPGGMQPTVRGRQIAQDVRAALVGLQAALDPPHFDPATARHTLVVETMDYFASVFLHYMVPMLSEAAPYVNVRMVPQSRATHEHLDTDEVQFAIGTYGDKIPERLGVEVLVKDEFVIAMRRGHALDKAEPVTLEEYLAAAHILVAPTGDPNGFVDHMLAKQGLSRRVAVVANQYSPVPPVLARSDLIVTVPRQVARTYARAFDLALRPAPVTAPEPFRTVQLIWHRQHGEQAPNAWFRSMIMKANAAMLAGGS